MSAFICKVIQNTLDHPNNHQTVNTVYQHILNANMRLQSQESDHQD